MALLAPNIFVGALQGPTGLVMVEAGRVEGDHRRPAPAVVTVALGARAANLGVVTAPRADAHRDAFVARQTLSAGDLGVIVGVVTLDAPLGVVKARVGCSQRRWSRQRH